MDYINLQENTLVVTKEPLAGNSLTYIFRLLTQNRFSVDFRYMPRLLYSNTNEHYYGSIPYKRKDKV